MTLAFISDTYCMSTTFFSGKNHPLAAYNHCKLDQRVNKDVQAAYNHCKLDQLVNKDVQAAYNHCKLDQREIGRASCRERV